MSKATSWSKHALEGDGNLTNLFQYLYKKTKNNYDSCPVKIPSTIVYEHNFPTGWYYYHKGELKKRSGKELETKAIYEEFTKNCDKNHDIVANFLSQVEDSGTKF